MSRELNNSWIVLWTNFYVQMQWLIHSIDISEISLLFNVLFSGPIHVDYFLLHWWYLSLFSQLPIVGPWYQFWPWNCLADLWTQWKIWQKTILQVNNFQKVPFVLTFIEKFERIVCAKSSHILRRPENWMQSQSKFLR